MTDIEASRRALVTRILEVPATTDPSARRTAFDAGGTAEPMQGLLEKVRSSAHAIEREDIARVRASGATEDEIFELVVCAAVGRATRRHEAAHAALEACTERK
jgi:hypothetical protein